MNHFLKWGQGPRPDLLEEDLLHQYKREKASRKNPEDGERKDLEPDKKDGIAMVLALLELLLPWILGGLFLSFLIVFLLTRIGA